MTESTLKAKEIGSVLVIPLRVHPRARKNQIDGVHNGALKIQVTAPPVDDAANKAIVEFFASQLELPRSGLKIVSGRRSRDKTLRIEGMSLDRFLSLLP